MKKYFFLIFIVFALVGVGLFAISRVDKKPINKPAATQEQPYSDLYYYQVDMPDGTQYVAKVNNYPDGSKELYQIFINDNNILTPYGDYLQKKQKEKQGGGIVTYQQNPTIKISSGQNVKFFKLSEGSAAMKAINAYIEKQDQQFQEALSTPPAEEPAQDLNDSNL